MLQQNIKIWKTYSQKVIDNIQIIIVDDGSPEEKAKIILESFLHNTPLKIHLFEIQNNIPWNQDGARNLAMYHTQGFCLLTDIDHILTNDSAEKIIDNNSYDPQTIYFINRIFSIKHQYQTKTNEEKQNNNDYKFINIYFIHHDLFWKIGGYNESFVGKYGSDRMFRQTLIDKKVKYDILPHQIFLNAYTSKDIHDSYTFDFDRSIPTKEEFEYMKKKQTPILNFNWKKIF